MRHLLLLSAATLIIGSSPAFSDGKVRQAAAHIHGKGEVLISIEGTELFVQVAAPKANFLKDGALPELSETTLADWAELSASAKCSLDSVEVTEFKHTPGDHEGHDHDEQEGHDEHDDHDHEDHGEHEDHAEHDDHDHEEHDAHEDHAEHDDHGHEEHDAHEDHDEHDDHGHEEHDAHEDHDEHNDHDHEEHDAYEDHAHEEHAGHSDLVISVTSTCTTPDKIQSVDLQIFESFDGFESAEVVFTTETGAGATNVTSGSTSVARP